MGTGNKGRRLFAVTLLLIGAANAQDTPKEGEAGEPSEQDLLVRSVELIMRPVRAQDRLRPDMGPAVDAWREEFEYQRKKAVKRLLKLVEFHGPGGEGSRLDLAPVHEALMSPLLMPDGKAAWDMAAKLLRASPRNPSCWNYARALYERAAATRGDDGPPWVELRAWAHKLRDEGGLAGEASLAVALLLAHLDFELGDKLAARREATAVLAGDPKSERARRDAIRLRSRASLREAGREAPAFRIAAAKDGEDPIALEDFRGRSVLLHFWHKDDENATLLAILHDCRELLPRTELVILNVPLVADPAEGEWRAFFDSLPGRKAAASHVGREIAAAYGVEGISALFLVSPDGILLASDGWKVNRGAERVQELVREAAGPPLRTRLEALAADPSYARFRRLWHGLVARKRTHFEPETWKGAYDLGTLPYWALVLAAADGGDKDSLQREVKPELLHARLVQAWRALHLTGDKAKWDEAIAAAGRPRDEEALVLADALFDLGLRGPEVIGVQERLATRASDWRTISMALRGLHFQDTTDRPGSLRKLGRADRWQVRLALAEALRAYRHKSSVDLLIDLLGDKRLRVRAKAEDMLEDMTDRSLGQSQKLWKKWRREQGADLRLRPREISLHNPFRKTERKYAHRAYYGLQVASNRVAFVLDKSDSMYYGLFDGVVEEMQAHLATTGPTTKFTVIEFADKPNPWSKTLVPVNQSNLGAAVEFLNRSKPYGATNIIDSLRLAMDIRDLDAIVLLSDGLPTRGDPKDPPAILAAVRKVNRYTRQAIHTVLLLTGREFPHDAPKENVPPPDAKELARRAELRDVARQTDLGAFLAALADQNDGTFGVGFADAWLPPPNAKFRDSTDK
jgi:hypothetical protein